MDGISIIIDNIRQMMQELFDDCRDVKGVMRSHVTDLGVTGVDAIFDVVMEYGFEPKTPYPVVHFLVTLAKDIDDKDAERISVALNELNQVMAVGNYPAFGAFCYYPGLHQIFLSYRLPVNPNVPEEETVNIRYYIATLYQQLDIFADFIMFICDTQGSAIDLDGYIDYIKSVEDLDDLEERSKALKEYLEKVESESGIADESSDKSPDKSSDKSPDKSSGKSSGKGPGKSSGKGSGKASGKAIDGEKQEKNRKTEDR